MSVSVIIPCYNAQKTVVRTVKSVLSQTFEEVEIILVDDASTDNTAIILDRLARADTRIQIVKHQKNMGEGAARFSGINASKGKYICFIDADDTFTPDAIKILYDTAEREHTDITEGAHTRILGRSNLIKRRTHIQNQVLRLPELMDDYFISFFGVNILSVTAWGKLYRRDLFDRSGIGPTGFKRGEDLVMNMRLFPFVRKWVTVDKDVYHYYYGGVTSTLDPSFYECSKKQYYMKLDMIYQYKYKKALRTTGIEMCNILNTTVKQMLLANCSDDEIRRFLEEEASSGFLSEITATAEVASGSKFLPIKNLDLDGIIATQRDGLWKTRLRRSVFRIATKVL